MEASSARLSRVPFFACMPSAGPKRTRAKSYLCFFLSFFFLSSGTVKTAFMIISLAYLLFPPVTPIKNNHLYHGRRVSASFGI